MKLPAGSSLICTRSCRAPATTRTDENPGLGAGISCVWVSAVAADDQMRRAVVLEVYDRDPMSSAQISGRGASRRAPATRWRCALESVVVLAAMFLPVLACPLDHFESGQKGP